MMKITPVESQPCDTDFHLSHQSSSTSSSSSSTSSTSASSSSSSASSSSLSIICPLPRRSQTHHPYQRIRPRSNLIRIKHSSNDSSSESDSDSDSSLKSNQIGSGNDGQTFGQDDEVLSEFLSLFNPSSKGSFLILSENLSNNMTHGFENAECTSVGSNLNDFNQSIHQVSASEQDWIASSPISRCLNPFSRQEGNKNLRSDDKIQDKEGGLIENFKELL
ncbi:expressed protein, partial [Phakopsora pachyrhizi]